MPHDIKNGEILPRAKDLKSLNAELAENGRGEREKRLQRPYGN